MKECCCPLCDTKYQKESEENSMLCDQCREDLLQEPKELLINMLEYLARINAIAMAALRTSPQLIEEFGLAPEFHGAGSMRRKLTLKELSKNRYGLR